MRPDPDAVDFLTIMSTVNVASTVIVFIFGTLIGSFLNVCIYRMPVGRSVVFPPSACGSCGKQLKWWQNLPIVSYLALQGACGNCYTPFSPRYAVVETIVGCLAALLWRHCGGPTYLFFYDFVLFGLVTVVFFVDLDYWIILDSTSLGGMVAGLVGSMFLPGRAVIELGWLEPIRLGMVPRPVGHLLAAALGALVGYLFFLAIASIGAWLARQEAMGGGDVKFAALIGAFLGWEQAMLSFILAFWIGGMVALPLFLWRGGRKRDPIPFGTFMAVGVVLVVLYGTAITHAAWRFGPYD
ncbi:MAG TPA: prepilin peptidase [Candidatus Xenobia bacterium]